MAWTATSKSATGEKGKFISETFESSSEESDDEDNISYAPKVVLVGVVTRHSGQPRQFTCSAAAEHFNLLMGQRLHMEKGFDEKFLKANPFVHERVKAHDWGVLATPNRKANSSLVKEFFIEASITKSTKVMVCGHWVQYDLTP